MSSRDGLLKLASRGGESSAVKRWLDEHFWKEVWETFKDLTAAKAELPDLLKVQAKAQVLSDILSEVETDEILAKDAEFQLSQLSKRNKKS